MKYSYRYSLIALAVATTCFVKDAAQAQQLYSENFDADHSPNWTANPGVGNNDANFFFDYSTVGIPSAPHSVGGTTRGVRLRANFSGAGGTTTGISVSPNAQNFTGDFKMTFDFWSNFNGNAAGTGVGTTQYTGAGVGTSGTTPQHTGVGATSVWFAQTGDGGNAAASKDYRAYSSTTGAGANTGYAPAAGVYAAGTVAASADNLTAYYATLGTNVVPAAQTAILASQTGTTLAGAPAFRWHTGEILKVGNTIKYSIDGLLIFTVDASGVIMDGGNIELIQSDSNGTVSTDVNAQTYAFGLFDNITVSNIAATVTVSASSPNAVEGGQDGAFTITRAGNDVSGSLTVNFTLTGTAVNGTDYTNAAGSLVPTSVTFLPNETSTNIVIKAVDDTLSELTENVILTLTTGGGYAIGSPASDTVTIADNDAQLLQISLVSPSMYERTANDYATFRITRLGDLNFPGTLVLDTTNFVFAGLGATAVSNVDFVVTNLPVQIFQGEVTKDINLIKPVNDGTLEGTETVVVKLAAGDGYSVSATTVTNNILDDEYVTPERILFADSLSTDTSANWKTNFAANNGFDDQRVLWGYTLATDGISNAPSGSLTALKVTVNKDEQSANGAAGINLYPLGQSFLNNYAVRFSMYLTLSTGGTTEYALFGINHSGNKTNWLIQSSAGSVTNTDADGFFFAVSADGSHSSPGDYVLFRGNGAAQPPLAVTSVSGLTLTNVFKSPPFLFAGALDNAVNSETGTWADVEIRKVNNTVTLRINNSVIISQGNATNYPPGNIMLGYSDPYPSVGTDGAVYYSNLRVVNLTPSITSVTKVGNNLMIRFITSDSFDTGTSFKVQSASSVAGPYTDDATASIALVTTGTFDATIPYVPGANLCYRIRHQ